jgi:hypothetical protein
MSFNFSRASKTSRFIFKPEVCRNVYSGAIVGKHKLNKRGAEKRTQSEAAFLK